MKSRFEGTDGRQRLVEVLKAQQVVEHDEKLAQQLADQGELVQFSAGDSLVVQGSADNDVYLLIQGEANVYVNDRHVATRGPRECIGEMAIIEPAAERSATVKAKASLLALKVPEPAFRAALNAFPHAWPALARVMADRLRQRAQFHRPPNQNPVLFIGCATETLPIAEAIQLGLKHAGIVVRPWTAGVFGPSGVPVDELLAQVDAADFAAFIFSPDDTVTSRGRSAWAPRDNVVFELGLFMGRLERSRTFIIKAHDDDIKIPSDLLGINPITYVRNPAGDIATMVGPVCTELRLVVARLGVR